MQTETVEESIRKYLLERFPLTRQRGINTNDSLLGKGILDSLGILDVVAFVEKEFQITVDDEDLQPENFSSIAAISTYVERKRTFSNME